MEPMRRSDREIKEREEILRIMERCDVCRLALHDEEYPYILPLNFGMETEGDQITLYFHGAETGKKYELIARDNRAGFEMDCAHRLVMEHGKDGCSCTMEYESVVGCGRLELVEEKEKYHALCLLMRHYYQEEVPFQEAAMSRTTVIKLTVERITGKRRKKSQNPTG